MGQPVSSASQDDWVAIVAGMKDAIRKRSAELLEMEPEALVDFAHYVSEVMDLEIHAQVFDSHVEEAMSGS